jgi:sigma-E factor negative regulatory protein RseC
MIEQQGRVVAERDGQALVELGGRPECAACAAGRGCGAGIFGRLLRQRRVVLPMANPLAAKRGQAVVVGLSEPWFLHLVVRFYLYPLLAGLVGGGFGHYLTSVLQPAAAVSDSVTLLAAILAGATMVWRNRRWSMEFSDSIDVHLLRVVENHDFDSDKEVVT